MIPNFAMDSTVEKHIQAMVASGASEWAEGGKKLLELNSRKRYVCVVIQNPIEKLTLELL